MMVFYMVFKLFGYRHIVILIFTCIGLQLWQIILISCSAVVIAGLVICIFSFWRKTNHKLELQDQNEDDHVFYNHNYNAGKVSGVELITPDRSSLLKTKKESANIQLDEISGASLQATQVGAIPPSRNSSFLDSAATPSEYYARRPSGGSIGSASALSFYKTMESASHANAPDSSPKDYEERGVSTSSIEL